MGEVGSEVLGKILGDGHAAARRAVVERRDQLVRELELGKLARLGCTRMAWTRHKEQISATTVGFRTLSRSLAGQSVMWRLPGSSCSPWPARSCCRRTG